jgi:hypothetical protein
MSSQPPPGGTPRSTARSRKSRYRRSEQSEPSPTISPIPFNQGLPTLASHAGISEQGPIRPRARRPGNVADRGGAASGGLPSPGGGVTGQSTSDRAAWITGQPLESPVPNQLHIAQEIAKRKEEVEKAMRDIGYLEQGRIPFNSRYRGMTYEDAHNDAWDKVTYAKVRIHELEQQRQRPSVSLRPASGGSGMDMPGAGPFTGLAPRRITPSAGPSTGFAPRRDTPGAGPSTGAAPGRDTLGAGPSTGFAPRRDTPGAGPSTGAAPRRDTPSAGPSAGELVQRWTATK